MPDKTNRFQLACVRCYLAVGWIEPFSISLVTGVAVSFAATNHNILAKHFLRLASGDRLVRICEKCHVRF